jgi:ATP phosphoribosyltransferase regulatory subunit
MDETPAIHPALLPAGLRDVLPPEGEIEARCVAAIMNCFDSHGYQRVITPLIEFEESLFAGAGAATADQTFRLMDPGSQKMMGLRADTTPQIARLAATRLSAAPRPLRLAYSAQCLRIRGSQLQPERQIAQAGIELIGPDKAEADAEIILTTAAAMAAVGLPDISFDLTVPWLVLSLMEQVEPKLRPELSRALDRKDSAAVSSFSTPYIGLFLKLLEASGPASRALPKLLAVDLPTTSKVHAIRIAETVRLLSALNPDLALTIDPIEFRGYRYHTGICTTVFAAGRQAELGRGGRYLSGNGEPATGVTLYPDTIVRVAPAPDVRPRLYLPYGTPPSEADFCRQQGFATIAALDGNAPESHEAERLGCSHVYHNGKIIVIVKDRV